MMYEYRCPQGHVTEEIFSLKDRVDHVQCDLCNGIAGRIVSLPADTKAKWGDSHAYFDRGLGCEVKSSQHKDKILKERDLVPVSEMGSGYVESRMTSSVDEAKAHDKTVSKYNDNVKKFDGDQGRAIAETFPAHEIL